VFKNKTFLVLFIVFVVLIIDQTTKIWVKTHMEIGEEIPFIAGWDNGVIHFIENPGMAFGIEFGGSIGKLALSLFRIAAVFFLIYYIRILIKTGEGTRGILVSFALIMAGALGNIIDSAFYGVIFSESPFHGGLATLFPPEGGYSSFLHGKVVDMLYFPLFSGLYPNWFPESLAGEPYLFFRPVFNVADSAITVGVATLLIFQRRYFKDESQNTVEETAEETTENTKETEA
jgi:signal peptidase II